jgi:hypothetical protein
LPAWPLIEPILTIRPNLRAVHPVPHGLRHVEAAAEIDVDHLVPHLAVIRFIVPSRVMPGIVDEHVDGPELALDLLDAARQAS